MDFLTFAKYIFLNFPLLSNSTQTRRFKYAIYSVPTARSRYEGSVRHASGGIALCGRRISKRPTPLAIYSCPSDKRQVAKPSPLTSRRIALQRKDTDSHWSAEKPRSTFPLVSGCSARKGNHFSVGRWRRTNYFPRIACWHSSLQYNPAQRQRMCPFDPICPLNYLLPFHSDQRRPRKSWELSEVKIAKQ